MAQRIDNHYLLTSEEYIDLRSQDSELETLKKRVKMLQDALHQLRVGGSYKEDGHHDIRIGKEDFLEIYNREMERMDDTDEALVYGEDVEVHWAGFYCNCGDGATAYNHIILGIENVLDEDDEEYGI